MASITAAGQGGECYKKYCFQKGALGLDYCPKYTSALCQRQKYHGIQEEEVFVAKITFWLIRPDDGWHKLALMEYGHDIY